jgi:ribosomal protein L11 methyltransferase
MQLLKLRVPAACLEAGRRAEILLRELLTPEALAITLFEEPCGRFAVEAYYHAAAPPAAVTQGLAALGPGLGSPAWTALGDENWVALSQAALSPVRAGRFLVHGRHDRRRVAALRTAIEIEAGEAFGTAHNATTVLCLELIDALVRIRHLGRALDFGCGTGILGIALARAQPQVRILASDHDPMATAIARANARLNGVAARLRIVDAESFNHRELRSGAQFDLLLANLLPGPLMALAPHVRRRLGRDGIAVLSGILDHQTREVCATYRAAGFRLLQRRSRDGWTALMLAVV